MASQYADQWFTIADKDGNGKIGIDEFIKFSKWLD